MEHKLPYILFEFQRSTKNETLTSTVKIEFGRNIIGESSKIEGKSDYTVDYNYNASWSCSLLDPLAIDDLVYKPVVGKKSYYPAMYYVHKTKIFHDVPKYYNTFKFVNFAHL